MNIVEQIKNIAIEENLGIGRSVRIHCIVCNSTDRGMEIKRLENGNLRYKCYHNSCSTYGVINSRGHRVSNSTAKAASYNYDNTYYLSKEDDKTAYLCNKFGLYPQEITRNKLLYNRRVGSFVVPIYDERGRGKGIIDRVYEYNRSTKAIMYWLSDDIILYKPDCLIASDTCILVEDWVSAIKISRYMPGYALCGTYLSPSMITYLFKKYKKVIVALDNDALSTAINICNTVGTFLDSVVQHLPKDIKDMTQEELEQLWSIELSPHVLETEQLMMLSDKA